MKHRKRDVKKSRTEYRHPTTAPLSLDAMLKLRGDLLNATLDLGCEVPAVYALSADRLKSVELSLPPVVELPSVTDILSPYLAHAYDIEVSNTPLPIAFLPHKVFDSSNMPGFEEEQQHFLQSIVFTDADRKKISEITTGQSKNIEWFNQRMGSLTASNFSSILRFVSGEQKRPEGLIRRIQNYRQRGSISASVPNVPSLKWGLKSEPVAVKNPTSLLSNLSTVICLLKLQDFV